MYSLINYPDEDHEVRRLYKEMLDRKGIPFDMPDSVFQRSHSAEAELRETPRGVGTGTGSAGG
jgi:hypothetical protein